MIHRVLTDFNSEVGGHPVVFARGAKPQAGLVSGENLRSAASVDGNVEGVARLAALRDGFQCGTHS